MKRILMMGQLFMLLTCIGLLAACSGNDSPSQPQAERSWYWEHELVGAGSRIATENHTVVLRLKPDAQVSKASGEVTALKTIPYTYKKSGRYEYCIEANDPYFVGMTITSESTGKQIAAVQQGACVQAEIAAGKHTVAITHKRLAAGDKERLAFIGVPKAIRLTGKTPAAAASAVDPTEIGKLAITDNKGNLLTLSSNQPASDGHENYFLTTVPMRTVTADDLFSFAIDPDNPASGYHLISSKGPLGAFYAENLPIPVYPPVVDPGYGDCQVQTVGVGSYITYLQGPLYTYSQKYTYTPPAAFFRLNDLGGYNFYLTLDLIRQSYVGIAGQNAACTSNAYNGDMYKTVFTVLYRYYDDSSLLPPLQQGEVALFEKTGYGGKAWVFMKDQPDLAKLTAAVSAARSVKTGPNTKVALYDNASGLRNTYVGYNMDDLSKTSITGSLASLQVSPDISNIKLSSKSCRYCDLSGFSIGSTGSGTWLDTYDFTGANFSNASFTNVTVFKSTFTGANLTGSTITTTIYDNNGGISNSDFTAALMNQITISGSYFFGMKYSTFDRADFTGANITKAYIYNSSFIGTKMVNAYIASSEIFCDNDQFVSDSSRCFSNKPGEQLDLSSSFIVRDNQADYYFVADWMDPTNVYGGDPANSQYLVLNQTVFIQPFTLSSKKKPTDLSNANFSGAIFADGMVVENVTKSCADMTARAGCVNFSGVTIKGAGFSDSMLKGGLFAGAIATGSSFNRATMPYADLSNANFSGAVFQGATLSYANLSGSSFFQARFNKDPVTNASAKLDNAFLYNANMASADLSGASMTYVSFHSVSSANKCQPADGSTIPSTCASAYQAIMANTNLTGAYLTSLDLSGATLNGAIFSGSFAIGANFTGTLLKVDPTSGMSTNFNRAALFGTDFTNAQTASTDFSNAYFDDQVSPPSFKGTSVAYLGNSYTAFAGVQPAYSDHVCAWYATRQLTVQNMLPVTDANITCPDFSKGPCNGSQWQASTALDPRLLVMTYKNGAAGVPAACNNSYTMWTNMAPSP